MYIEYFKDVKRKRRMTSNLSKDVYNFFVNSQDEELKSKNSTLKLDGFDFEAVINRDEQPNPKRRITLITALTQSGKTFTMIECVCINLAQNYTPVVIVKDVHQKVQFADRYETVSQKLCKFLEETKGYTKQDLEIFKGYVYEDSKSLGKRKLREKMIKALDGTSRKLILSIHHGKHLERIQEKITPDSNLALFIDEAHKLGGYKKLDEHGILTNSNVEIDKMVSTLKESAKKIYLITATPQDILLSEPNLYADGIIYLPRGKDYVGLTDWTFKNIDENKDENIFLIPGNDKTNTKASFLEIMAQLSLEKPIPRRDKFGNEGFHPISVLARFEDTNHKQLFLLKSFAPENKPVNNEHKTIQDANWAVMTFNQYGVTLYHDSLRNREITVGSETVLVSEQGLCVLKNAQIGEVWHWLATNGGIEKFPRLCTIAYRSAEEGITYCSTWTGNKKTDMSWHITHAYVRTGKGAPCSDVEQCFGRANGNHGDNLKPIIYCTQKDKIKLVKAYNLREEQIDALYTLNLTKGDVNVQDSVRKMPVFANRIPKSYYRFRGATETFFNRQINPDGKLEDMAIIKAGKADTCLTVLNPQFVGQKKREEWLEKAEQYKLKHELPILPTITKPSEVTVQRDKIPLASRELFDHIYSHIEKNNFFDKWIDAYTMYRKNKPDQQTCFHWFEKYNHKQGEKSLCIRRLGKSARYQIIIRKRPGF
jgi:hypothetical protein